MGPLLFIIYLSDLPYGLHQENKPVTYADYVSVLLTASNKAELTTQISHMLDYMTEWFSVNGLILNTDKTNIMKFSPSNRQNNSFQFTHHTKLLVAANNTKFLGLELDKHVNWKNHVRKILARLSGACYLIRRLYTSCNINTLRMIYFAYFHSIMEYGIMFWGTSGESRRIFLQQKRIIRIMTGSSRRTPCKPLFQTLKILTLTSQYVFSLMRFLSSNLHKFTFISTIHSFNTRQKHKLHKPVANLIMYQRSSYYTCINIYNKLSNVLVSQIANKKQFLLKLKEYLVDRPYYMLDEFMSD